MKAHFLVAKYAPDLKRMEPRNIGIILWSNGLTASRFFGDSATDSHLKLPKAVGVADVGNYRDWIGSWRRELSKPALELSRGRFVDRSSADYVEGFRELANGNYMLVYGGTVELRGAAVSELKDAVDYLFTEIVAQPEGAAAASQESVLLKEKANEIWRSTGVWDRPDFRKEQPVFYDVYGERKSFTFDYAVGPSETPYSIYHRVVLGQQRAFDSIFMNVEHYRQARGLEKGRCNALVASPGSDSAKRANHRLLSCIANVIDLADENSARDALLDAASLNGKPRT
jgi:hypothetical protein